MILGKKIDNHEMLDRLEALFLVYNSYNDMILKIMDSKMDINVTDNRFSKYVDEYIHSYIMFNTARAAIDNMYLPIVCKLNPKIVSNILFSISLIIVQFDDSYINEYNKEIHSLLDNGYIEMDLDGVNNG